MTSPRPKEGKGRSPPGAGSMSLAQMLAAADAILDRLPIATCICDLSGRIVQYNRRAVAIWGRVPEPNETHDHFTADATFYGPDGAPLPRSQIPMALVLRTGMPVRDCELVVQRPDGVRHVVAVNIDPLVDGHGNRLGAINCFQDITERKQIHDALAQSRSDLREQEQRLAATYEHAAIGIAEVDAQGRLLRVNEAV